MKIASSYIYAAESKGMTVDDATNTRTLLTTDQYGLGYTNGLPCDAGTHSKIDKISFLNKNLLIIFKK